MRIKTIKAIFTNLLFVIGVVLVIFGFTRGALTAANLVVFDKYPLNSYEERQCGEGFTRVPMKPLDVEVSNTPNTVTKSQKAECEASLEHSRKIKMINDVIGSLSMLICGTTLVLGFKKFIFD